jgi:hypothetical protein
MIMGARGRLILATDFRTSFAPRRVPVLALLVCGGMLLVVQRGDVPPLLAAWIVAFSALDRQFNNILYRSPGELEALTLFPLSWRGVILAKNLATVCAAVLLFIIASMCILYFAPQQPGLSQFAAAGLFAWTEVFPLLIIGNLRSVQEPGKATQGTGDDLIQAAGMAVLVLISAVPYILLCTIGDQPLAALLYGAILAVVWYRRSLPGTASRAQNLLASQ